MIALADIEAAAARLHGLITRTPLLPFRAPDAEPDGAQAAFERLCFEEAVRTVEAGIARWGRPENA